MINSLKTVPSLQRLPNIPYVARRDPPANKDDRFIVVRLSIEGFGVTEGGFGGIIIL